MTARSPRLQPRSGIRPCAAPNAPPSSSAVACGRPRMATPCDIDTAKAILKTASGKICVISNSRRSGYGYDQRIEAFCSNGLLRAGNVHLSTVESWDGEGAHGDALQNFFLDRYEAAYRAEMSHFAELIDGADPYCGYEDGIAALNLAEAAAESHSTNRVVVLGT